jgi:dihydroxy-acid dehydratase
MNSRRKTPEQLRSHRWYGVHNLRSHSHHSRTLQMGFAREDYRGKPVIAIVNTWSEMNSCHVHFRARAEEVKRGVWQAGGFPLEVPAMSLGEPFMKPTTMLYRNLLAMEVEETLRCHPFDGAVLLGGCDKTTPAMIMGALSMDIPAIFVPAGPMLRGMFQGQPIGSGSDTWKFWAELGAGNMTCADWDETMGAMSRSFGTCMTMGTASTMMSAAEALGLTLPGAASIPAADSHHSRMASASGRRIVDMVWEDLKPRDIVTSESIRNAITTVMALGGSTNAVVHLVAVARRAGLSLPLETFDEVSRKVPWLANIRPGGKYLMEDFYYAGGLRALLAQILDLLHGGARTVNGKTLAENLAGAKVFFPDVIRPRDNALASEGGLAILRGNLCPNGAVIKPIAAEPKLLQHRGKAVVFSDYNDMDARLNDSATPIDASSVIVLQSAGPRGGPGMPEWGMLPIPSRLLKQGVRDMVRISDARMSGTSYGTCVLHVAPESAVGGPLALVRSGDEIELDVAKRRLNLLVSDSELARRRAEWRPPPRKYERGYGSMFLDHVTQADEGCDFDFLDRGQAVPEPEIH